MKDKSFFDTNILVYANDSSEPIKQEKSRFIIKDALYKQNGVISVQVLNEFWVTVTQKIEKKLPEETALKQIELMELMEIADLTVPLFKDALIFKKRYQLSFWDSLIIAAAFQSGCTHVLSEDLNHGQVIQGMTITNPFIS